MLRTELQNLMLTERLLHLGSRQTLEVPYNPSALTYTITGENELYHNGAFCSLSRQQLLVVNLLRLAHGQPVLRDEALSCMDADAAKRKNDILSYALNSASGLNNRLLAGVKEPNHPPLITSDSSKPPLLRLTRTITFVDARAAEPPYTPILERFAHFATPIWSLQKLPRRKGDAPPLSKADLYRCMVQDVGGAALAAGIVSLADMYSLSLRYAEADYLHRTMLPIPGGQRVVYDRLFPEGVSMPASSIEYSSALLGRKKESLAAINQAAMGKLVYYSQRNRVG